jgi:hypothetical protein
MYGTGASNLESMEYLVLTTQGNVKKTGRWGS